MSHRIVAGWLLISGLFAVPSFGQSAAPAASTSNDGIRREVEAVNRAMEEAFNRGDLVGVARFYADDARIMGPRGEIVQSRERLDRYWAGIRNMNPRSWKLDVIEVGGSRDEPWQLGRSTLVTGTAGQEQSSITDFIVLWRRQADGQLRIYIDLYPGGGGGGGN